MNLGIQQQPTPLRPLEGFIGYDPLNMTFLIDEDLENYMILHNWIRALGTPDDTQERKTFMERELKEWNSDKLTADGTLVILNSNFKQNFNVVFMDLIPQSF